MRLRLAKIRDNVTVIGGEMNSGDGAVVGVEQGDRRDAVQNREIEVAQ